MIPFNFNGNGNRRQVFLTFMIFFVILSILSVSYVHMVEAKEKPVKKVEGKENKIEAKVEEGEDKFLGGILNPPGNDDDEPVSIPGAGGISIGGDDDESGPQPITAPAEDDEDEVESHEMECSLFNMLECGIGNFCKGNGFGSCNGTVGICTGVPLFCSATYAPVCGCNGQTYSNECRAFAELQNVAHTGVCEEEERVALVDSGDSMKTTIDIVIENENENKEDATTISDSVNNERKEPVQGMKPDKEAILEMKKKMKERYSKNKKEHRR